ARAGGVVCRSCAESTAAIALSPEGAAGIEALLKLPLAESGGVQLRSRGAREILATVTASYEHHGGFRLRTLSA
ncbi:MAG TPA: hypothetical protein VKE23_11675, partial [Candidatus Limnocylindria bacterium]|nr:hypothetical protein [Candidatus Limnocylindria bacterium]